MPSYLGLAHPLELVNNIMKVLHPCGPEAMSRDRGEIKKNRPTLSIKIKQ
jgi:hypothetical protein